MKLTVTKNLNVRVGEASLNAPCYQYIAPGSILEVDGKLYKGDAFESINTWYKDAAGNFYWSGGVEESQQKETIISYADIVQNFGSSWLQNKGAGVTTVIIDTGVMLNAAHFNTALVKEMNLADNNNDLYHGNFIAGIIAGTGSVKGIAPDSSLLSIRYKSNTYSDTSKLLANLISALDTVLGLSGPVVVNLSQGFPPELINDFQLQKEIIAQKIKEIGAQKNKFIVCSAGDNDFINALIFPASLHNCISVGTIDKETFQGGIVLSNSLDILTPMYNYNSYNNNFEVIQKMGSSFSTAMISALITSLISCNPASTFTKNDLLLKLKEFAVNRNAFVYDKMQAFQYENTSI